MRRLVVSSMLILLLAHVVLATNFDSGFYRITNDESMRSVVTQSGRKVHVGKMEQLQIKKVTLTSRDNWNEKFYLHIEVPYDPSLEKGQWHVLVVSGEAYKQSSGGSSQKKTSSLGFTIFGRKKAEAVAQYFSIKPCLRVHPGYQFAVKFIPMKEKFAHGENVLVTLMIKNIGTNTVAFQKGGRNRASRDNQYEFVARHRGKQVSDIGQPGHFGGLSFRKVLKPGEVFMNSVNLCKWFDFKKPGTYEILGTYVMEFNDPDDESWFTIWEGYVSAEFSLSIMEPKEASNKELKATDKSAP